MTDRLLELAERYRRNGTHEWKQRASASEHSRYAEPVEAKSRRRCHCGCRRRATHRGMANGICLTNGCELSVARWVSSLANYYASIALRAKAQEQSHG